MSSEELEPMQILLIEDDDKLASSVQKGLQTEGHEVTVTKTGEEGYFLASGNTFDVVLLDILLPGRSGLDILSRMREMQLATPVLLLTARDAVEDRIRGLDAGADDYLVKPFAFGELLARLRALVRRDPAPRPASLSVGDVILDPATRRVSRGGVDVELSAREFSLLEFLMRHPGEVLPRSRILEHVWDYNYDHFSNVVDVYVGYLRRKLEQPSGRPLIRTVRGVGYAVDPVAAA